MNVYDFDGIIYDGDSTVDFYICIKKTSVVTSVCTKTDRGICIICDETNKKTRLKEFFFSFLTFDN